MQKQRAATLFAILAAALYAVNVPLSKLLLNHVAPTMMAALLYLGAGFGLLAYRLAVRMLGGCAVKEPLTKKELPYTVAMIVLDIAAPILLMLGIARTTSSGVSLLNNFEIVATSVIALVVFREAISPRLWVAIALVTLSGVLLGFEGTDTIVIDEGALFVLGACICWGFENNCTRKLSSKSSVEIVTIKGCFSGLGSLVIARLSGEPLPAARWVFAALALGFVAYGLSINFYILAQKDLGAAKTSGYYAIAPFLGVAFSMALLGERPRAQFYVALLIMIVATVLMLNDTTALQHMHRHMHVHTHAHRHGELVHTHAHAHVHAHPHAHDGQEEAAAHTHAHARIAGHRHAHPSNG